MKYHYDFYNDGSSDPQPQPPVRLIKRANQEAKQSFRLYESWEVLKRKIARILGQPDYREISEASDRKVFLGWVGTVMFLLGLFVEWHFSKNIYLSQTEFGFFLFLGIVAAGIYCSACFSQLTHEYRLRRQPKPVKKQLHAELYPNRKNGRRTTLDAGKVV